MSVVCFYAADNQSGKGMSMHTVGLTLSYSF